MKSIEDDFQGLADEIITGKVTAPDPKQKVIVDDLNGTLPGRAPSTEERAPTRLA